MFNPKVVSRDIEKQEIGHYVHDGQKQQQRCGLLANTEQPHI